MPLSAWIMLVFGCIVLYGLLAVCLVVAFRSMKKKREEGVTDEE